MQSIVTLKTSAHNATEDYISQKTMENAADIIAQAPHLEAIQMGDYSSNKYIFGIEAGIPTGSVSVYPKGDGNPLYSA